MSVVLIDGGLGTELTNMGYSTEVNETFTLSFLNINILTQLIHLNKN